MRCAMEVARCEGHHRLSRLASLTPNVLAVTKEVGADVLREHRRPARQQLAVCRLPRTNLRTQTFAGDFAAGTAMLASEQYGGRCTGR